MTPNQLANQLEALIFEADGTYSQQITRIQAILYHHVLLIVKQLETDADGYILQNSVNRKLLNEADLKINEVFSGAAYQKAVRDYVSVVTAVNTLNRSYFADMPGFKENRVFLKSLQNQTIKAIEKYILKDGLQAQVINPLSQILNQNINSGGMYSAFLEQIRTFIKGNQDVEGRAMRYTRTYLKDTLFQFARNYQESVSNDLGLEWYLYAGGLMDKSRDFCIERAGRYYHKKDVESWAGLDWKGKNPQTTASSIFTFAGGYNCSHQLIPVHESIVPTDVLAQDLEVR